MRHFNWTTVGGIPPPPPPPPFTFLNHNVFEATDKKCFEMLDTLKIQSWDRPILYSAQFVNYYLWHICDGGAWPYFYYYVMGPFCYVMYCIQCIEWLVVLGHLGRGLLFIPACFAFFFFCSQTWFSNTHVTTAYVMSSTTSFLVLTPNKQLY